MNFPLLNAVLNTTATILLVAGLILIRQGNEAAHKKAMLSAFFCSVVFLASYIWHHYSVGLRIAYAGPEWGEIPYLTMLLVHTVLAVTVPFLVIKVIRHALKDERSLHKKWARITAPIWLFVSISGVLIYLILYVWTDSYAAAL
jgi:putative membrane protein